MNLGFCSLLLLPALALASKKEDTSMRQNFSGAKEFWECLKTVPAARAYECAGRLVTPAGQTSIPIDVSKPLPGPLQKLPVAFTVQPNWLWLIVGFAIGYAIK